MAKRDDPAVEAALAWLDVLRARADASGDEEGREAAVRVATELVMIHHVQVGPVARRIGVTAHWLRKAAYAHPVTIALIAKAEAQTGARKRGPVSDARHHHSHADGPRCHPGVHADSYDSDGA
ncbi:hypothetical protein [Streptomyces sp. NPDC053048]|uniref:hypothetical protein n=1 Tax=Streptomyces sp. NPDC053048 TaxID=3365694 RepID=UPI0037D072BC